MLDLKSVFENLNLDITENESIKFNTYYNLLIEQNKVMNLTAITDWNDVVIKHFADSVSISEAVPEFKAAANKKVNLIDIGTGAGFPGIPLKIMFPSLSVTLLDSLQKRVNFLDKTTEALSLNDITSVHMRAEEGGRNPLFRDKYDFAVSRAVADLAVLAEYCLPFVKTGGYFIAYKSGTIEEEVIRAKHSASVLGGHIERVYHFELPDSDIQRSFVVIKKVKPTPKAFPRKAGTAKKAPL